MKTVKFFDDQIIQLHKSLGATDKTKKSVIKSLNKQIQEARQLRFYLESKPDEDHLKKQLSQLIDKKRKIESEFGKWVNASNYSHKNEAAKFTAYKTEMGVQKIEAQIETLELILNN